MFNMIVLFLIPYYELIFRTSTTGDFSLLSVMLTLLFSFGYSAFAAIPMRLFKSPRTNRIITSIILFVIPVIYLIEFFVYRSFKVFYDVNTVVNGAGGVAAGFKADVARLVFCYDGISRILLFLLPFLVYVFFISKKDPASKYKPSDILYFAVTGIILIFLTGMVTTHTNRYKNVYDTEYNYQSAVESLGFGTGVRLDVMRIIRKDDDDISFEIAGFGNAASHNDALNQNAGGLERFLDAPSINTFEKNITLASILSEYQNTKNDPAASNRLWQNPVAVSSAPDDIDIEIAESYTHESENDTESISEGESDEPVSDPEPVFLTDNDPAEYGVNALDIDFAALAESASGTQRDLDLYVASLTPSSKNRYTGMFEGKNLIFFSAEAFSGYIIDPELTPTLYRLSTKGIQIDDYYQPAIAGTTGGEYSNLFGLIPSLGGKSMKAITSQNTWITIGNRLNDLGYYGKAYHNNSGEVYGREETHNNLGYSDGFMGVGDGMEDFLSGTGFPASDLEMMEGTLPTYIDKQPFNVYYMTVSGHGQYGRHINKMSAKNYDRVADLDYSEIVKCYIANNLELEDALTYTVNELEKAGIADDTVIVLGADHFPYSLDNDASLGHMPNLSELYGFNVTNYIERDHNRLIIWSGCLEDEEPIVVDEPVFSLDILPTLCNLFGVEFESRLLPGRDIFSDKEALVFTGGYDWKTTKGTYIASSNTFTPSSEDTVIPEGYVNAVKTDVRNRMTYCKGILSCDYFDHVFN